MATREGLLCFLGALLLVTLACAGPEAPPKWIVVGIDGADPSALERMWQQGKLPAMKALATAGIFQPIQTDWRWSPQIWTTMATGVDPEQHGITDFIVHTEHGDLPVSSEVRRVPALWNMLSATERQVAVLGWWASWPAEEVAGVIVSDRPFDDVEHRTHPAGLADALPTAAEVVASSQASQNFGFADLPWNGDIPQKDELFARKALELVPSGYDLLLVYVRSVDAMSHHFWRDFARREPSTVRRFERNRRLVAAAYEAADRLVGRIVEAAGTEVNVVVLSDHGFKVRRPAQRRICIDTDRLLAKLDLLVAAERGVDIDASRLYTFDSTVCAGRKKLRFGGAGGSEAAVRRELAGKLDQVTYKSGRRVFAIHSPTEDDLAEDIGIVLSVDHKNATTEVLYASQDVSDVVIDLEVITGNHDATTPGIFLAAGPDIAPNVQLRQLHVRDIAPTLLYGLGLPVARDFTGRVQSRLFVDDFEDRFPRTRIASWGSREPGAATPTLDDAETLDELRALGYLD